MDPFAKFFFQHRNQLQLHHWMTKRSIIHIKIDEYLKVFDEKADSIMESMLSVYNIKNKILNITIPVINDEDNSLSEYLKESINVFQDLKRYEPENIPISTVIDEILIELNKLSYLAQMDPVD
jgi:hypothetical protein